MTATGWFGLGLAAAFGCSPAQPPEVGGPESFSGAAAASGGAGGCVVAGPEICYNARDDNCNGPIDEGCGVEGGLVQFSIAWRERKADVDLEVTDPKGRLAETGAREGDEPGLVRDRDCPGQDDACRGVNLENVTATARGALLRGTYRVEVRLEHWEELERPVRVQLGARLGPRSFATEFLLDREKQERKFALEL